MEQKDNQLQEQNAPLKNHDNAFVQVGKHGEPVIPQQAAEDKETTEEEEGTTTLDKR